MPEHAVPATCRGTARRLAQERTNQTGSHHSTDDVDTKLRKAEDCWPRCDQLLQHTRAMLREMEERGVFGGR
jgi:hypothetical protein